MAKATTTIKQVLNYQPQHAAWFAANQTLFNQVAAFYFEVIQAHEKVLDLKNKEALTALECLTHATNKNPNPVMPLSTIGEDIPAMFRRAAIKVDRSGWKSAHRLFLPNYGSSTSSPYGAHTQKAAYRGVEEAAGF